MKTRVTVTATPTLQELGPFGPHDETASTVTGTYQGEPITGKAYVEQWGDWK